MQHSREGAGGWNRGAEPAKGRGRPEADRIDPGAGTPDELAEREKAIRQLGVRRGTSAWDVYIAQTAADLGAILDQYRYGLEHGLLGGIARYPQYIARVLAEGDEPWQDWWPPGRARKRQRIDRAVARPSSRAHLRVADVIAEATRTYWDSPRMLAGAVRSYMESARFLGREIEISESEESWLRRLEGAPSGRVTRAEAIAYGIKVPVAHPTRREHIQRALVALRRDHGRRTA